MCLSPPLEPVSVVEKEVRNKCTQPRDYRTKFPVTSSNVSKESANNVSQVHGSASARGRHHDRPNQRLPGQYRRTHPARKQAEREARAPQQRPGKRLISIHSRGREASLRRRTRY